MTYGMKGGDANRQQPKRPGKNKFAHTANTPYGMGDNYGTGLKAKIGKIRDGYSANPIPSGKLKTPPRGLA